VIEKRRLLAKYARGDNRSRHVERSETSPPLMPLLLSQGF